MYVNVLYCTCTYIKLVYMYSVEKERESVCVGVCARVVCVCILYIVVLRISRTDGVHVARLIADTREEGTGWRWGWRDNLKVSSWCAYARHSALDVVSSISYRVHSTYSVVEMRGTKIHVECLPGGHAVPRKLADLKSQKRRPIIGRDSQAWTRGARGEGGGIRGCCCCCCCCLELASVGVECVECQPDALAGVQSSSTTGGRPRQGRRACCGPSCVAGRRAVAPVCLQSTQSGSVRACVRACVLRTGPSSTARAEKKCGNYQKMILGK
jgi:hypothetical protein